MSNRSGRIRGGYNTPNIIDTVDNSTQKVRRGEALYEQDGVCFYEPNNNYELLAALLYAKTQLDELSVLDFGGALGSTYFRYRNLWDELGVKWCCVEQEHFVARGKKTVPEISFFYNMDEALSSANKPNVLLLSGVLQYLDDPTVWFASMLDKGFKYIILEETAFDTDKHAGNKIMLQHVPESIYKAVYPINLLGYNELKDQIEQSGYEIVWEWNFYGGQIPIKDGLFFRNTVDKGMLLKKR